MPYDVATAKAFGHIRAQLEETGAILPDADLQIAVTAIYPDLEFIDGNLRHFSRTPNQKINPILAEARSDQRK